jgi:hypothetical protein
VNQSIDIWKLTTWIPTGSTVIDVEAHPAANTVVTSLVASGVVRAAARGHVGVAAVARWSPTSRRRQLAARLAIGPAVRVGRDQVVRWVHDHLDQAWARRDPAARRWVAPVDHRAAPRCCSSGLNSAAATTKTS